MDLLLKRWLIWITISALLAAAILAALVPRHLDHPDQALQGAVAQAIALDDRLLEVALEQYPRRGPAIVVAYGQLPIFREQLARFGPQVVPIVAAYQTSFTTADVRQLGQDAWQALRQALASLTTIRPRLSPAAEPRHGPGQGGASPEARSDDFEALDLRRLTPEERGLIALLNMRDQGNAFVGQWEITGQGEARRIPSRLVSLAGPEILFGGLTDLERRIVQQREIDWRTYGVAAVDLAAIASGVALLRFAQTAARGAKATRAATRTVTLRSGVLAAVEVLGITARFAAPIGLLVLMVWYPGVFTHAMWVLAEGLGLPGIVGPAIGWAVVVVPLALLLSWMLLSVRLLRLVAWLCAGAARACHNLAGRLAAVDRA